MSFSKAQALFLPILIFLSFGNTLWPWGLDKIGFLTIGLFACSRGFRASFFYSQKSFSIIILLALWCCFSIINLGRLSYKSDFYLISFFFFVTAIIVFFIERDASRLARSFIYSAMLHALLGLAYLGKAYFLGGGDWVEPLWGKGMPHVYAAKGYTTTPQVYATLSSLALITLAFLDSGIGRAGKFFLGLTFIFSIFASLNRVWLLFLALILSGRLVRNLIIFFSCAVASAFFAYHFSDVIIFSGTIASRFEMMGLLTDFFFNQDNLSILIGNPFYDGTYFNLHDKNFNYIESGPLFIAFNFGLIGLCFFYGFLLIWLLYLFSKSKLFFFYSFYYLIFVQAATHEFLSVSFWYYWILSAAILQILRDRDRLAKPV